MEIIYCRIPHPQSANWRSNCHLQLAYITWGEKSPSADGDLGVKIQMRYYIVFHTYLNNPSTNHQTYLYYF